MRKIVITAVLITFFSSWVGAQKEAAFWFFGNKAGLDFRSGMPEPLRESQMNAYEGCASYSSPQGKLLFYTDGVTVWNSRHEIMPGGENLAGDTSSTQSALVVPHPGQEALYYLFTADELNFSQGEIETQGLRYSLINMSLDKGKGALVEKNIPVLAQSPEKITAVQKGSQSAYWLIGHEWGNNKFSAWMIDKNGFNPVPVESTSGTAHVQIQEHNIINSIGNMKLNPQGNRLAVVLLRASLVEIFDFDNETGIVSNPISIEFDYEAVYSAEFSPDGTKLYITSIRSLYQLDLEAGSSEDIAASLTEIYEESYYMGTMQSAPNGKIYCTVDESDHLGVIHNPNAAASECNYESQALYLEGGQSRLGLPNFISSHFIPPGFYAYPACYGAETHFYIPDTAGLDSVLWNFDDPASGAQNTSVKFSPSHFYADTGTYSVELTRWSEGSEMPETEPVTIRYAFDFELGSDSVFCDTSEHTLNLTDERRQYLWWDGRNENTRSFSETGSYWAEARSLYTGCKNSDTIAFVFSTRPPADLGPDTVFCSNDIFVLEPAQHCDSCDYLWQDASKESRFFPESSGNYSLQLTNGDGCSQSDTVFLELRNPPKFSIGKDTVLCEGETLILNPGQVQGDFLWQDGSRSDDFLAEETGEYFLRISNICGEYTDSIRVDYKYCGPVDIPNVFTPNTDGINDTFVIKGINQLVWQLNVFSRWGNRVYHSADYQNNWSPRNLSAGVYYYILQCPEIGARHTGFVHLIK